MIRLLALCIALLASCEARAWTHGFPGIPKNIVTDFGAACDGVTNDAAAFAAAGAWMIANQGNNRIILDLPTGATCLFNGTPTQASWLLAGGDGGLNISAAADNGSGKLRLTTTSTAALSTGWVVSISGLTGTPLGNGQQTITVIDSTHVDVLAINFVASGVGANSKLHSQHGVKNLLVRLNTGRIKNTSGDPIRFGTAGLKVDSRHSARTSSVSAGSTTITLLDSSLATLFKAGTYAQMTGFDIQGIYGAAYGFPPNLHFNEYVFITNIAGATITIATPLRNSYLSTWPNYNSGSAGEVDSAGPATLFYVDPAWAGRFEYRNGTIEIPAQTGAVGQTVVFNSVTMCPSVFPSQNETFSFVNSNTVGCTIEMDKLVTTVSVTGGSYGEFWFQSSSIDNLVLTNATVNNLNGTPKSTTCSNVTFTSIFRPGAVAQGASTGAVNCPNSTMGSVLLGGTGDTGSATGIGIQNTMTMSGGVISYPNGMMVSNAVNGPGNHPRLTVNDTTGFATGQAVNISGVGGVTGVNTTSGAVAITVVDGTTIDIPSTTFGGTYTSGGIVGNYAPYWAVPGANVFFGDTGTLAAATYIFQVVAVTQTATPGTGKTNIQTSHAGGFPTATGNLRVSTHPAPSITCSGCSGSVEALDLAAAPAGAPLWSYAQRTYTGSIGSTAQAKPYLWGNADTINFNVTQAYGGAGALNFALSSGDNWPILKSDDTVVQWNNSGSGPKANAKSVGNRQMQLSGTTCPSGTCTGDTGLAFPDATKSWFGGVSNTGPAYSADVSGSCPGVNCPSVTLTMKTNQGVVWP